MDISLETLRDCLGEVPALELQEMTLLRQCQPALLPALDTTLPRETIAEAVREIVAYTQACRDTAKRLSDLRPVVLAVEILEFGL